MKALASNSRGSGGIARCLDGAVASRLHTATSCHRITSVPTAKIFASTTRLSVSGGRISGTSGRSLVSGGGISDPESRPFAAGGGISDPESRPFVSGGGVVAADSRSSGTGGASPDANSPSPEAGGRAFLAQNRPFCTKLALFDLFTRLSTLLHHAYRPLGHQRPGNVFRQSEFKMGIAFVFARTG